MSIWIVLGVLLVLLLLGGLLFTFAGDFFLASVVHSRYPKGVSFTGGGRHFSTLTYYGTAWIREGEDQCPYTIHLSSGDIGAADLANEDQLVAKGWTKITDAQALKTGLPQILHFEEGDYAVDVTYHTKDIPVCVTVGVKSMDKVVPDARGIAVSLQGKRLLLPASEEELLRVFGEPTERFRQSQY